MKSDHMFVRQFWRQLSVLDVHCDVCYEDHPERVCVRAIRSEHVCKKCAD
jgi:hypothetical protein